MPKKILLVLLLMICLSVIVFTADPFYTNLLNEGKQLYLAGKYDEALESFKIAEFGLLDDREIVPELYFYYALAYYKKGAVKESRELLEKMKAALGGAEPATLAKPKEIERDLDIMIRVLKHLGQPGAKVISPAFLSLFYDTWDLLTQGDLAAAETNLKRLDKMGGDEVRLRFLEGFMAFQKQDYKKCIGRLEKIVVSLPEELNEDASFYLAFSYLKRGDQESAAKHSQKIKNPNYVHRLMLLKEEIKTEPQAKNGKK